MVKRYLGGVMSGTTSASATGSGAKGLINVSTISQIKSISATTVYGGTPTANATSATYVVVAGGQSGSTYFAAPDQGAGGGGGEVLQGTITGITAGAPGVITITVGAGGTAPASTTSPGANGNLGSNSSISGTGFSTVTARRGGNSNAGNYVSGTGGTSGNGNAGSAGIGSSIGAGGGNGGAGGTPSSSGGGYAGQGGLGTNVAFANMPTREFGGGGGGGSSGSVPPGKASAGLSGGEGGTYNGTNNSQASGSNGAANTGGGGGGHGLGDTRAGSVSGNGGSGRVMVRVLTFDGTTTYFTPTATGTYTSYVYLSGITAYTVYDFTGSGSITF